MQQIKITIDPITKAKTTANLALELPANSDNTPIVPITATIVVLLGSTVVSQGDIPTTITVSGNVLKHAWEPAAQTDLSVGPNGPYRAEWVVNGDIILQRFFLTTYWSLENPITEIDVINEDPSLEDNRIRKESLTADVGSTSSMIKCQQLFEENGYWTGSIAFMLSGENRDFKRRIILWDKPTKELSLEEPLGYSPRPYDRFSILKSWNNEIEQAWDEVTDCILKWSSTSTELGINLAVDALDMRPFHLYTTMIRIYTKLRISEKDAWDLLIKTYEIKRDKAFAALKVKVDIDNNGSFDENDTSRRGGIWAVR